jgi:hypothetical protein
MTGVRRSAGSILIMSVVAFGQTTPAQGDVTYATVSNPTPVSFYAGRVAWSALDPARHGYVLMTHAAGSMSPVPVQPRGVPFDVDLGPDEHGDTVAVYSRCGREPQGTGTPGTVIPRWRTGRGCDIFKFSFATGRETRVASANGARSSEFLPSIWDTRIAFARVYERRKGRAGDRAYLYARAVLGSSRSDRLKVGPRSSGRLCLFPPEGGGPVCGVEVEVGPTALDLRGRRLAFTWSTRGGSCPATVTGAWLDSLGGGRRQVETTCTTNLQGREIVSPSISAGRVYYVKSLTGGDQGTAGSIRSYRISSRRRSEIFALKSRVIMWSATDAGRTFYLLSGGFTGSCAPDPGSPGSAGPCFINEFTHQHPVGPG